MWQDTVSWQRASYGRVLIVPMNPRVSVILPFRNAAETIGRALRSLQCQSLREIEVLAVDDRSTDAGPALVRSFQAEDSRVRLFESNAPHGVVAAINTAWPLCRASMIARMDADDVSFPRRLECQLDLFNRDPLLSCAGCQVEIPGADEGFLRYLDWSNSLLSPESIARERFVECPVVNPTMFARREVLESVGGHVDSPWAEDYDLWLRILAAGHRVAKVPEILYQWNDDRPGRLTRSDPRYSRENFMRARAHYLASLPQAERGFAICGAGPTGKTLARFLLEEGASVLWFHDVSKGRIGERIGGIRVLGGAPIASSGPGRNGPVFLSCVGSPGGRERVRRLLEDAGQEGQDFFCCA